MWSEQKIWVQQKLMDSKTDWQIIATHMNCGWEADWYASLYRDYGLDLLITGLERFGKV